jgi:hypothetical protein
MLFCFFYGLAMRKIIHVEKAAVCEAGTEGHTGQDKKSLCFLI